MNTKKGFVTALAAAVAVSSVAAVSVSAIGPGETTSDVRSSATAEPGKVTHFSVTINDVTIDADVPADAITAGETLTFGAALVTNVDIENAVNQLTDVATSELLDVYFLDANNENVSFNGTGVNVTVTTTATAYETIYIYEEETGLSKLAETTDNKLSFIAPHFSYYVLTKNADKSDEPTSQQPAIDNNGSNGNNGNNGSDNNNTNTNNNTNNGSGVNTGDSTTTATVFAIVGAAALGTALVASKSKKHAK